MGLDGISVNQLRTGTELNSKELNKLNTQINPQFIDGLARGQRINADDKNNQDEEHGKKQNKNNENDSNEEDINELIEEDEHETNSNNSENSAYDNKPVKYDLSDSKRYMLKVDENNDNILIIEKNSQQIIQSFTPEALSNLTQYLPNFKGLLINRKQ